MASNSIVYFSADGAIHAADRELLTRFPFFATLLESINDDIATKSNPIRLDMSEQTLRYVLDYTRGELYAPIWMTKEFAALLQPPTYSQEQLLDINVGGYNYTTTRETLIKLPYFDNLLNRFNNELPTFINRDGLKFKHVLALARNPDYLIDETTCDASEINCEYQFFGIGSDFCKSLPLPNVSGTPGGLFTVIYNSEYMDPQRDASHYANTFPNVDSHTLSGVGLRTLPSRENYTMKGVIKSPTEVSFYMPQFGELLELHCIVVVKPLTLNDIKSIQFKNHTGGVYESITPDLIRLWFLRNPTERYLYERHLQNGQLYLPLCFATTRHNFQLLSVGLVYSGIEIAVEFMQEHDLSIEKITLRSTYVFLDNFDKDKAIQEVKTGLWKRYKTHHLTTETGTISDPIPEKIDMCVIKITSSSANPLKLARLRANAIDVICIGGIDSDRFAIKNQISPNLLVTKDNTNYITWYFLPIGTHPFKYSDSGSIEADAKKLMIELAVQKADVTILHQCVNKYTISDGWMRIE